MVICAATGNAGKLKELRRILSALGHEVKSQKSSKYRFSSNIPDFLIIACKVL